MKRFRVRLFALPHRNVWASPAGPKPEQKPGFTVDAKNIDRALNKARQRLELRGFRVRAVSCAVGGELLAYVEEPLKG